MRHALVFLAKATAVLAVLLFAGIGFFSITRGTPVRTVLSLGEYAPRAVGEPLFVRTMELLGGVHVDSGNVVEVLSDGDGTYPRLWADLRAARRSITMQMYYAKPGATADTAWRLLAERARAGVRVLLLLDAFGAKPLRGEWTDRLAATGVEIAWLRPVRWYSLHKANFRSHVRAVVVDGRVGYTGGFGLADYWQGDGRHDDQWREANVRFAGPSAMQLQAAFAAGWAEATGELLTGDLFFPADGFAPTGPRQAGLLFTTPTMGSTAAERFLLLSIAGAQRRLYIANSYFVPDDDFRRQLIDAVRRGVDVRVLTAGEKTDVKTTRYAGRSRYEQLLAGGVRIYEYRPTMMHAKTFVADGHWSMIGSMNFDNRSLAFNNESALVVADTGIGATMDSLFVEDLRYSDEITLERFRRRSWLERAAELGAGLLSRLL